jgi:hypothetical protein
MRFLLHQLRGLYVLGFVPRLIGAGFAPIVAEVIVGVFLGWGWGLLVGLAVAAVIVARVLVLEPDDPDTGVFLAAVFWLVVAAAVVAVLVFVGIRYGWWWAAGLVLPLVGGATASIHLAAGAVRLLSPSDEVLREAHGTPVITLKQGQAIEDGTTKEELFERLGGSSRQIDDELGSECFWYPESRTGKRLPDGNVLAVGWKFCFDAEGRLESSYREDRLSDSV